MSLTLLFSIVTILAVLGTSLLAILTRYKMCPPDKILVVYGAIGKSRSSKCHAGGAAFVLPVLQSYGFLDLRPMSIDVPLRGALSSQNIRIDVPSSFTIGISTEQGVMQNAATRLLGLQTSEIRDLASEIILGQMRVAIASMTIEEINADREKLVLAISRGVDTELNKVGLKMINCNISDIKDSSGYIEALGREAAARAINEANIKVAEETRKGEVGRAEAQRDQTVAVAQALAAARLGENESAIIMAESDAQRKAREAEFDKVAEAAREVQAAAAREEAYHAQARAELARAEEQRNKLITEQVVPAEIAKRQAEIAAEAKAQESRLKARGEADAVVAQKEAEAKGLREVLSAEAEGLLAKLNAEAKGARNLLEGRADGFAKLLESTGKDLDSVSRLIVAERIVEISETVSTAASKIKMDKVVVMGSGQGPSAISSLTQDIFRSVLPIRELTQELGIPFLDGKSSERPSAPAPTPETNPTRPTSAPEPQMA